MSYSRQEVMGRALHFATKNGRVLEEELGFDVHGMVWSTDQQSVVNAKVEYQRAKMPFTCGTEAATRDCAAF